MKNISYKFTDVEFKYIEQAKTIWLNKQGMSLDDAERTPVDRWVLDFLIWKITWNLVEKPKGHISKKLPI